VKSSNTKTSEYMLLLFLFFFQSLDFNDYTCEYLWTIGFTAYQDYIAAFFFPSLTSSATL